MVATINNPPVERRVERERIVERSDSGAGWAVAVIILLAIIVAGAYWYTHRAPAAPAQQPGANIQVNLPSAGTQPSDTSGSGAGSASAPTQTTNP